MPYRIFCPVVCILAVVLSGCSTLSPRLDDELARCSLLAEDPLKPAKITFTNSSAEPRSLYWIPAHAEPTLYRTLAAGESHEQDTYVSHLWAAAKGKRRVTSSFCVDGSIENAELK